MSPKDKAGLHAAVFRNTAKDPAWVGYWLARHQQTEDLEEEQLADKLGVPMDDLVLLCLCRTPRADHFGEDLKVICQHTGASEAVLAQILRKEQILHHWTAAGQPQDQGWLMAASDRPDEADSGPPTAPEERDDK